MVATSTQVRRLSLSLAIKLAKLKVDNCCRICQLWIWLSRFPSRAKFPQQQTRLAQ